MYMYIHTGTGKKSLNIEGLTNMQTVASFPLMIHVHVSRFVTRIKYMYHLQDHHCLPFYGRRQFVLFQLQCNFNFMI